VAGAVDCRSPSLGGEILDLADDLALRRLFASSNPATEMMRIRPGASAKTV
jgi:hypothetical protein